MKMNRRTLLKRAAVATPLASLFSGLPAGWVGTAYASDAPETPTMRFGIIALTDNASIVMAHELGYFKKFGIDSVISKEASWAVIRDKLTKTVIRRDKGRATTGINVSAARPRKANMTKTTRTKAMVSVV